MRLMPIVMLIFISLLMSLMPTLPTNISTRAVSDSMLLLLLLMTMLMLTPMTMLMLMLMTMMLLMTMLRYALRKKLRDYLGIFPKWRNPPPIPPFWEPLIQKKKLSFILHFRPLGTFLVFTKKLKFCQYFYIYFWE